MPGDRALQRKIAEGEYQDCSAWAEGETRRWRFGFGKGQMENDEQTDVGGVGRDFRWRKWRGLERELRKEMAKRGKVIEQDVRPAQDGETSAYSVSPGRRFLSGSRAILRPTIS